MSIINNSATALWKAQFTDQMDSSLASEILKKFKFVSASEFRTDLHSHILRTIPASAKAAFFIERELQLVHRKWQYKQSSGYKVKNRFMGKIAVGMYQEKSSSRGKGLPKRWTISGSPLPAVKSSQNLTQDIGSEGVVATLVSKVCKTAPSRLVLHPHTNALADMQVQYLVIVTDFIGSGTRTKQMLDSLWRLASVRSWKSAGFVKILVICYSATDYGYEEVIKHPCEPKIAKVCACPTIFNSFPRKKALAVEELCGRFPPDSDSPLGYKSTGALIAFEHSCPNNVPAMFIDSKPGVWNALFPKRITDNQSVSQLICPSYSSKVDALDTLKCEKIAKHTAFSASTQDQQAVIVLLVAVYRGRRHTHEIVTACGMPLVQVTKAWESAAEQGLLTKAGRLSYAGYTLLQTLLSPSSLHPTVAISQNKNYYPSSLRELVVKS